MNTLIARLKNSVRMPLAAAALVAGLGTTAVHAACPSHVILNYETYTLSCTLISEYFSGYCLMDCVEIDVRPTRG
jgi:hypothetical protein